MKKSLFFLLLLSMQPIANAADSFSTLEERMSGKEFMETGLDKLTDQELEALNEWVRSHSVATLDNAKPRPAGSTGNYASTEDLRGFETRPSDDAYSDIIRSNIVGTFEGWSGNDNLFTLENGMIWKQVESDTFNIKAINNPEVTIKKSMMGAWRLSME